MQTIIDTPLDEIITPNQIESIREYRRIGKIIKQDRNDFEPIVKDIMKKNNITEFSVKGSNGAKVRYIDGYTKTVIDESKLTKELERLGIDIAKLDIYKETEVSDQIKILL